MESDLSGNITDEYVFLGGKRIARRKSPSGEIHYYFADHLGSSRVVTSATGQILDDSDFYPFGGERPVTSATDNNYLFTGKERDTESGLDNFIKRYHASSLGRFMTPDPIGIMKQKLTDPQQWNMYSYARNNPLRFIDPLGMYVCTDQKQCAEFEKARLAVLNSKSSTAADLRAAKAYGKLGDKNGVYVSFADNLKNDRGGTVTRHDTGIEADSSGPNGVRASVNVTIQSNQASNEETLVHEGSHVADRQEFVASLRPDGTSSNPALNLTLRESEIKAYQLSIQHAQRGNLTLNFGPCGLMDECKFPPAMMPAMRDQRINELLDDPRNHYDNLDNFLYPEFKWP
jgi:RHS repeat-associated protein